MTSLFLITLFLLGLTGGFFSGLLGIGGGIIMVPLLLYIPSLVGIGAITMKTAAGITMVQSLAGSFSGLLVHRKNKFVHFHLVLYMGSSGIIGSLIGSVFSKHLESEVMLGIFAIMALIATMIMYLLNNDKDDEISVEDITFNKYLAVLVALIVGLLGGIVGQGGAFILIPLMLYVLKIPTRIALGSSVGIAFLSALAGFVGKWSTGQIPFVMALVLVAGSVLGAQLGGYLSKRMNTSGLRLVLNLVITGTALKMWFELNPKVAYLIMFGLLILAIIFLNKTKKTEIHNEISNTK